MNSHTNEAYMIEIILEFKFRSDLETRNIPDNWFSELGTSFTKIVD